MDLRIQWKPKRIDEFDDPGPPLGEGMIEIDARIEVEGEDAGTTDGFYLLTEDPASPAAFFDFWDMEQWTCDIRGELLASPGGKKFREPLPRLLEATPGILFIRVIALTPAHRGKGIGREVLKHWLDRWCDPGVGAVILHAEPLQRRPGAFEFHGDEIRDLPWDSPEEDRERLLRHLRSWGFHRMAGTPFVVATPHGLGVEKTEDWDSEGFDGISPRFSEDPDDEEDIPF